MAETRSTSNFTAEERAAMKERAREVKEAKKGADAEKTVLAAIEKMADPDREIAQKLHEMVREVAPHLVPKTFYGSPGYAKDGKVVFFFQDKGKYKTRYSTLGFQETAALDDGEFWPTSFAVTGWSPSIEEEIARLITRAAG
ncbi:iron chaperone [Microbacterium sp. P06]|uniref:iron chaperone n=1 Tax=Microbacterium sp. P06 TaxID=3366949 RepID=UPI003745E630